MERVRMFLSPSGILGMKYWVPWVSLVWVVWLEGTLTPADVLMEEVGIAAGRCKHAEKSTGGKPCVCGCLVFPAKGLSWERG